jgi:hypothetical protein
MNRVLYFIILFLSFIHAELNYNFINFSPSTKNLLKKYCIIGDKQYENAIFYIQNDSKDYLKIKSILKKIPPHSRVLIFIGNKLVINGCKPGFTDEEKIYIDKHLSFFHKALEDIKGEAKTNYEYFLAAIKNALKKESFANNSLANFKILENYPQSDVFIFYNKFIKPNEDMNYAYIYVDKYKYYKKNKDLFAKYKGFIKGEYLQFPSFKKVNFYTIPLFMKINNRQLKVQILLKIGDNKNILNGWIEVYGVLLAPLKGKVNIKNNVIYKIDAKVADDFYYYGNWAKKGDRLHLILKHGKYEGKYYNYGYVFKSNPSQYFEYTLIGK